MTEAFKTYCLLLEQSGKEYTHEYLDEARGKIDNINHIVRSIKEHEISLQKQLSVGDRIGARASVKEIHIKSEAFYYAAWRLRNILRKLPALQSFECVGVRTVRNWLLEHPENNPTPILSSSIQIGGAYGPVLGVLRPEGDDIRVWDSGLYRNVDQFEGNLVNLVRIFEKKLKSDAA